MSRVLWLGDAGCTTGFARVTHAIGERLMRDYGHDVHVLATNFDGDAGRWDTPLKLYRPTLRDPGDTYGLSRFVELLGEVVPDIVVMLNDPYVVLKFLLRNKQWDPEALMARVAPMLAYMPVDGTNFPTNWAKLPTIVNGLPPHEQGTGPEFVPVVMSEYGRTLFPDAELVYHGIESDLFKPPTLKEPLVTSTNVRITGKGDAKELFGIPRDAFLVLRVDRNSHRKNFGDTWRALVPVMQRHKNVHAWFHCKYQGDQLELAQLISRAPEIADNFHFPDRFNTRIGWKTEDLIALYAAADLFVSTSWGEGFGLTLAEAASMQVPVIAQNVASIPEVVGPGGILLEPERLTVTESGQDQWLPSVDAFSEAIEKLYTSAGARRELGEAGRQHVVKSFSWDDAASRFHELINTTVTTAVTRTERRRVEARKVAAKEATSGTRALSPA
jgi:glycosyltransferase involved in cell wall biosynthesis